jgi:hypothetical protein
MPIQLDHTDTISEVDQIVEALFTLPVDKVAEVRDFVWFLQARYVHSPSIDCSDGWSEQDTQDLTAATLAYAGQSLWTDDDDNDESR